MSIHLFSINDIVGWNHEAIAASGGGYMGEISKDNKEPLTVSCVVPTANGTCGRCDPALCDPERRSQVMFLAGTSHCQMVALRDSNGKPIDSPYGQFMSAAYLKPRRVSGR